MTSPPSSPVLVSLGSKQLRRTESLLTLQDSAVAKSFDIALCPLETTLINLVSDSAYDTALFSGFR